MAEEDRHFGVSDQLSQVKLLNLGRYDVVLSDRYIFNYFVKQVKLMNSLVTHEVDEHRFTTPAPRDYRPVFRDKKVRDDFNFGLKQLKKNGEFQKIYDRYIN